MNKPHVLAIADPKDSEILDVERQNENWVLFWKILDYAKLHTRVDEIRELIEKNNVDFVLYSRNDQVGNRVSIGSITRTLEIGYSSISGIDKKYRVSQMKTCFEDFMNCKSSLNFNISEGEQNPEEINQKRGTFSLVFDTEQLACGKYGLPRIFEILKRYDVRATFFVTNVMKKVYPNIVKEIQKRGHEVGLHGQWHEYLSKYSAEEQQKLVKGMVKDFDCPVYGANFVGRMNNDTLIALLENGIKYFVYPSINSYKFLCYPKLPTNPSLISINKEAIWMLPVSFETYNYPWFSIRNMIDSAFSESLKTNHHFTILLHPFRDGNLQHISITERMLRYLVHEKELEGVAAKDALLDDKIHIDRCKIIETDYSRIGHLIPRTKEDLIFALPEYLTKICKIVRKNHSMW